ncbi:MAG: dephospho-CoA kinase [Chitinophagaceae bacterium]|nr:dephospho-CoA kinase [Chitinophagaceae bacterium]
MLKIGLTGGLGSGKSTVARIFEVLGVPVYYADEASKRLMIEDDEVKSKILFAFGKEVYPEGKLDRKYLAAIVFKDSQKLELLNSIVHPATLLDAQNWMDKQITPYAIKEAALIFESGSHKFLDKVIGVSSPLELRIGRAATRDKIPNEEVLARINNQMDEENKLRLCDHVIINDEKQMLISQVLKLHHYFLDLTKT